MSFKKTLMNILPKPLVSLLRERHYLNTYKGYMRGLKSIHTQLSKKIKLAFIVEYPEVWNSINSVYAAAVNSDIETIIVCVPKTVPNKNDYVLKDDGVNAAKDFFDGINVNTINALEKPNQWFDLESYNPDYVIYTRPYNSEYPTPYKSSTVCNYAKVCYIPYAFSQTTGLLFDLTFNWDFMLNTNITFVPSKIRLSDCKKKFAWQVFRKTNHYEYLGFPRFDILKNLYTDDRKTEGIKTIAWLPRWSFDDFAGQKKSHFLDYYEPIIAFMQKHREINLIIRPHPLMFHSMIQKNIRTENEINEIRRQIENEPNISFDSEKDYLPLMKKADVLVSDFTSLLIEYFVSGKPIIYCDNSDDFNADAALMDSTLYHADDWDELEQTLTALINGNDDKYDERQKAIGQLMPQNAGKIGESIVRYLQNDYNNSRG